MLARIVTFALAAVIAAPIATPLAAAELLMFKDDACMWCARWDAEVGPDYPASAAAAVAPLRRIDLRGDPLPDGLELDARVRYTPTFVLVEGGREIGRITGYPGRGAFWLQLDRLLETLDEPGPGRDAKQDSAREAPADTGAVGRPG